MKIKNIVVILLAAVLALSFTACAGGKENTENSGNARPPQSNKEESQAPGTASDDGSSVQNNKTEGSKILVAYFSATNNTEGVA